MKRSLLAACIVVVACLIAAPVGAEAYALPVGCDAVCLATAAGVSVEYSDPLDSPHLATRLGGHVEDGLFFHAPRRSARPQRRDDD